MSAPTVTVACSSGAAVLAWLSLMRQSYTRGSGVALHSTTALARSAANAAVAPNAATALARMLRVLMARLMWRPSGQRPHLLAPQSGLRATQPAALPSPCAPDRAAQPTGRGP